MTSTYICSCFEVTVDPNVYSDMNIDTNWEWDSESRAKPKAFYMHWKILRFL